MKIPQPERPGLRPQNPKPAGRCQAITIMPRGLLEVQSLVSPLKPLLCLVLLLLAAPPHANAAYSIAESSNFTLDTRFFTSRGDSHSGLFLLDTRFGASSHFSNSGDFTLDTRGTSEGVGVILVQVLSGEMPLEGATVRVERHGQTLRAASTPAGGLIQLGEIPAGPIRVSVSKPGFTRATSEPRALVGGGSEGFHFRLDPPGAPPVVARVDREVKATEERPADLPNESADLWLWRDNQWVQGGDPAPGRMTVVITHGWNSTASAAWVAAMARAIQSGKHPDRQLNILAWDWEKRANTIRPGIDEASRQGVRLGMALAAVFQAGHDQPAHFIGHSLGAIVNRYAADYLHGDLPGKRPAIPWEISKTRLTLCDQAEVASVAGDAVIQAAAQTVILGAHFSGALFSAVEAAAENWKSPIPNRAAWVDNYISFVGLPKGRAVNVYLSQSPDRAGSGLDYLVKAHGYAYDWYTEGATAPDPTYGFRFSAEKTTGNLSPAKPFPLGAILKQFDPADPQKLARVTSISDFLATHGALWGRLTLQKPGEVLQASYVGVVNAAGNALVSMVEALPVGRVLDFAASVPVAIFQNGLEGLSGSALETHWVPQYTLGPRLAPRPGGLRAAAEEAPGAVWVEAAVPTGIASISFDFNFSGHLNDDALVFAINGTNRMNFDAALFPEKSSHNSGLVDISDLAGRDAEFFFGLRGGTATDGSVAVSNIQFHSALQPSLEIAKLENGRVRLTWFAGTGAGRLESSQTLEPGEWAALNRPATITNFQKQITTPITPENQFFRLAP